MLIDKTFKLLTSKTSKLLIDKITTLTTKTKQQKCKTTKRFKNMNKQNFKIVYRRLNDKNVNGHKNSRCYTKNLFTSYN
jgi:hypothetical protein